MSGAERVVVAVSGVDGAGKSTLIRGLQQRFAARGTATEVVWFRPGMGMAWVDRPVRLLKRLLGQSRGPTVRTIAQETSSTPTSRRGAVGWVWCLLVTVTYLAHVRGALRGRRGHQGVVLMDRHLADALVTFDVFYRGVDLRLPRWLVRRLLPRADASVYLSLPVEVAVARKPGDTIEVHAVSAQVAAYPAYVREVGRVSEIDATSPADEVLDAAWAHVSTVLGPLLDGPSARVEPGS